MHPESHSPGLAVACTAHAEASPAPAASPAAANPVLCTEPGRLLEFQAAALADQPSAAAAALLLAAGSARRTPLIWLRCESAERRTGKVYGPGLAAHGIDPARVLLGILPDELSVLKAAADVLRSGSAGAVLLELHGQAARLDLTASRRLALAAAATGTLALVLKVAAEARPSAAWQRWAIGCAHSQPLPARAPGPPALAFELTRNRAGPGGARGTLHWQAGRFTAPVPPETAAPEKTVDPLAHALAGRPVPVPPGRSLPPNRAAA